MAHQGMWWNSGSAGMWWHRENMAAQRGCGGWLIRECGGIVAQRGYGGSSGNMVA